MKEKICFFTGHRILPSARYEAIRELLQKHILELIENGVTTFIWGGALGFDCLAAKTVLEIKENIQPGIQLWLYVPCLNHTEKWRDTEKEQYFTLSAASDKILYVSKKQYTKDCMHRRNQKMAEDSAHCIAFMLTAKSGTGSAVRYAKQSGCKVINISDEIYEEK